MIDVPAITTYLITNYGLLGVFVISLVGNATIFFPVPTYLLVYALGAKMNPLLLGLFAGTGAAIGELTSYVVGYGIEKGARVKKRKFRRRYVGIRNLFKKYGFWIIPIFAATPLPMDAVGLMAGFLNYPLRKFFLGCLLGKIAVHLVIAYAGFRSYEFIKQFFGGNQSHIWLAFGILLVALLLAWMFYASRNVNEENFK
ncbi:MAG: VTT domain-containing protein [Candidatus Diapherotrites archaeon]|nr:VTT domain-containing protein [Candidatus Diapherotrites archaeon]